MPPESLDQKLARFLRSQRGGLTYTQFARKVGLGESTLHRIENGQQSATLRAVQLILKGLKCSYSDVFESASPGLRVAESNPPVGKRPEKKTFYQKTPKPRK